LFSISRSVSVIPEITSQYNGTCDRVFSLCQCRSHATRRTAVWIRLWRRMALSLLRVRFV